jgi:integrase
MSGFLDGDPTASIPVPRAPKCLPKPVTEEELAAMLDALPEPLRTAAYLAGYAGMRVSEIAACRREHITVETILIPDGKGGDPGVVPTHPIVWTTVVNRPPGLLVLNRRGRPVDGHWITQTARYHLDRMGMPDVHLHRLRHRYGTLIQATVGDLRVTQECMRHRSVTSTAGYTLVTGDAKRAAVAALPAPRGARAGY